MEEYETRFYNKFIQLFLNNKSKILEKIYYKYEILKDDYLKELWNECLKCNTFADLMWYEETIEKIER